MDGIAIKAMVKELAPVIREYAEAAQAPLIERITSLETEKAALATRCEALEEAAKNVPEIDVEKLIADEIAKLPELDLSEEVGKEVAPLKAENAALAARCKALEDAAAKPVEFDLTGMATRSEVEKLIADEIAKIEPAKEIDSEELATLVNEAVAALPPAQDGNSVEIEDVLPVIAAEVAKAFEAVPVPKDGEPGKDGRGVKELLIDREGHLIATMDDGATKNLGPVCGKDGQPGQDGRDGFNLTDFDAQVLEDDRTIEFKFVSGDYERVATLKWPTMIYRGVYSEGKQYDAGDTVSWGGSAWVAERATNGKPDTAQSGWKLAVKKGMKGADAPSVVAARNG